MLIGMLQSVKHVNCHKLYSTGHVSRTRSLAIYYGEVQVDQHACETVGHLGIGDNDVVL